jgi:G3E family GTPase
VIAKSAGVGETAIKADDTMLCTTRDETALAGGCSCCTIRSDLVVALRRLKTDRDRGRIGHFNHLAIETGADSLPVLRTFMTDRALGADFHADALVDASVVGNVSSFVLTEDSPLTWDAFSRFMETLVRLRGADMLQADGWLNVAGCRGPVVVRYMQHLALPPVELMAWSDKARRSRVTFVTRHIPESEVRRLFDAVLALPSA